MKQVLHITLLILLMVGNPVYAKDPHICTTDAIKQASKLLEFHFGSDDRISIDEEVTEVASIKNPVNEKQQFDVLEVWGQIYKGNYKMHFIYAQLEGECLLMGQEILEFSNL